MDKIFAEMFSKEPYKIIDGDYFYFNPYHDDSSDEETKWHSEFKVNWERRSHNDFSPFMIWTDHFEMTDYKFSEMKEIFSKIATEGKPFIDISSSISWGLFRL